MLQRPVSDFEMEAYREGVNKEELQSRYEFLKAHHGIRPNTLHGLMGTTGGGKSTLLKCIIAETAAHIPVLVWLSEEKIVEYQDLIAKLDPTCLKNIIFVEEKSIPENCLESQADFFEYFEQMVDEAEVGIVFIDNVTTSMFYSQTVGLAGQNKTSRWLLDFVKRKASVFYAAHTQSKITDNYNKVITAEDIRGSKELPIHTEYLYILQRFTKEDKIFAFINVVKYRHHENARGWFALKYEKKAYTEAKRVGFDLVNNIFRTRDYLGKAFRKKKKPEDEKTELKSDNKNK